MGNQAEDLLNQSNERYRRLVDTISHGVEEIDPSGIITTANRAYHKLFEYGDGELTGMSILDFVATDSERGELRDYLKYLVLEQPPPTPYFGKKRTKKGRVIDVQVDWEYNRDTEGRVMGFISVITDITERLRSVEALRDREERFDLAVRGSNDGLWVWNILTNDEWWSPRFFEILGYKDYEIEAVFDSWASRIHPDDHERVVKAIDAHLKGSVPYNVDYRHLYKDGTYHWQNSRGQATFDENGKPVKMAGFIRDITEDKQVERALKESQERYRAVAEDTPVLICRFLPGGEITYVNEAYCKYFAKTSEELVGQTFLSLIPESERETVMTNISALEVDSSTHSHEHLVIAPDGEIRWQRWTNRALFDTAGKTVAYQCIGEDVTERRHAEEALRMSEKKYRSLVDQSPDPIFKSRIDNFQFTEVNQRACKNYGYTREEFLAMKIFDIETEPPLRKEVKDFYNSIEIGQVVESHGTNKRKNGSTFPVHVRFTKLDNQFAIAIVRDITALRQTEEQMKTALEEKELLLREVHHRVKNNLQLVSSMLNIQSSYLTKTRAAEMLTDTHNRIHIMALIHEQLFRADDLSKVDCQIYIERLTDYLLRSYEIEPNSINIQVEVKSVSLMIDDAINIGVIIHELVSNCIKHAFPISDESAVQPGVAKNDICIELYPVTKNRLMLLVQDNGVGIQDDLDLQHPSSFGLDLVKILVSQLKGSVELDRQGGTTFRISFPL